MNESELALWHQLRASQTKMTETKNWIYIALDEGLLSIPHPKQSIQWGYTDNIAVIGGFKVHRG